jgi:G3E family GTPase
VGCSLAASLVARIKEIKRTVNPDYLFVEPSEMVLTQEMVDATRMGRRDVSYDIGPFITLIDGPAFERVWEERQPLLLGQIHKADLVAVSRTDLLGAAQVKGILLTLKEYRNPVLMLSVRTGQGLEEVMQPIVTG